MKFIDLFAGIGGFRLGMEANGHECLAFCEKDKFARASYKAMHDTTGETEWHDITSVSNDDFRLFRGRVDIICGGFPCQAFSIAGKRGGFSDTRGTLFFEIARAAEQIKPRYLFLENVKGLLNHDNGRTFGTILNALDELGYDAEWCVLNSKDFGVPQNRERVFIVGHLRGTGRREIFPLTGVNGASNSAIVKVGNIRENGKSQSGDVFSVEGLSPTLCAGGLQKDPVKIAQPVLAPNRAEKRQNGRRFKEDGEPMFTLTAQDRHGVAMQQVSELRIRRLTPRECWRLQGFPDALFDKAKEVNSDSQLYKQAGNSVTVNVIAAIAANFE